MGQVKFTVEGWDPILKKEVKMGVALKTADVKDQEEYLKMFREALEALYRHQCLKLGVESEEEV